LHLYERCGGCGSEEEKPQDIEVEMEKQYNQERVVETMLTDANGNMFLPLMSIASLNKMDTDAFTNKIGYLKKKWLIDDYVGLEHVDAMKKLVNNFLFEENVFMIEAIEQSADMLWMEIKSMIYHLHKNKNKNEDELPQFADKVDVQQVDTDLKRIVDIYDFAYKNVLTQYSSKLILSGKTYSPNDLNYLKPKYSPEDLSGKQQLLLNILQRLNEHGYRKLNESCYVQRYTKEGCATHSYRRVGTIREFIVKQCDKDTDPENWCILTKGVTSAILDDLERTIVIGNDLEFPSVKKNRHKFSFKNGVLITKVPVIITSPDGTQTTQYKDEFYKYGTEKYELLDDQEAAAKFHDYDLDEYKDCEDWYNIPTPNLQKILDYQLKDKDEHHEICRIIYAFIGRMLFDRNDLDNWQLMVYVEGAAGSGKSTISDKIISLFYDELDIAVLDNKIERQFGLAPLAARNPLITIGNEFDKKCQLDVATLLKMVSGETITAAVKNKDPFALKWITHIWLSSNDPPSWEDKQGSLTRRIANILFEYKVRAEDADPKLEEKLKGEIPAILFKSAKAYLELTNNHGKQDFWCFCPKYFQFTKSRLAKNTNILRKFLEEGDFVFGPLKSMPEKMFYHQYREFAKEAGYHDQLDIKNKDIVYKNLLQDINEERGLNLSYEKRSGEYKGTMVYESAFFVGMDINLEGEDRDQAQLLLQGGN